MAGTAAPLNPAYREDEFRFYLEDTAARVLILPANGAEEARRAAGDRLPIFTADLDAAGMVHLGRPALSDLRLRLDFAAFSQPAVGRCRAGAAYEWQHGPAEAGPARSRAT